MDNMHTWPDPSGQPPALHDDEDAADVNKLTPAELAAEYQEISGKMTQVAPTLDDALQTAMGAISREDLICVTGSFYLVGEAKREGLDMIPSAKFKNNYAFLQIVMLAYNIWRYMKMIANQSVSADRSQAAAADGSVLKGIMNNTVRIARLKLLFIAAKVVKDGNRDKVEYSIHDARTPTMFYLLQYLDNARSRIRPWHHGGIWPTRFAI